MNKKITSYIINTLNSTVKPIESRKFASQISRRFHTSIFRVYGIISFLEKSGKLTFTLKKPGGASFLR